MPRRLVLLVTVSALLAAGILWYRGAFRDPFPDRPGGVYVSSSVREFRDLGEMAATSDLVVRARVAAVGRGATTTVPDGSGDAFTARLLTLDVQKVLWQSDSPVPDVVKVYDGYWSDGIGFEAEDVPWARRGEGGYFFLTADSSGHYSLVHQEGRVLVQDGHAHPSGTRDLWGELARRGNGPAAVEELVLGAAEDARSGRAKSVPITVCRPSVPDDEDSEPICEEQG